MKTSSKTTKRGAASLFVVIITIILLGVITLGFTRLILSEANQTSNTDLSQSAYDSALAGIEDAKIAILRYHACLADGHSADANSLPDTCEYFISQMQNGINSNSCDTVANILGRSQNRVEGDTTGGEVIIQETQDSNSSGSSEYMSQAYTCVTIKEDLEDYRTTLNSTDRLRVVPIRTTDINRLSSIDVEWYSDTNNTNNGRKSSTFADDISIYNNGFPVNNEKTQRTAPVISVQLIQTDQSFKLSELDASRSNNNTDVAMLYLRPTSKNEDKTQHISASQVADTANKSIRNDPFDAYCAVRSPFYCKTNISLPSTYRGESRDPYTSFLVLGLPYGVSNTDIAITLRDKDGKALAFNGVQAKVDSTGRANDLYRRVESRIELADAYFPYPEFTIQMTGNGDESSIEKSFWVTNNCWSSNSGEVKSCSNSGNATPGF